MTSRTQDDTLWDDLLNSTIQYTWQTSRDEFGNPETSATTSYACYITSRTKAGGSEGSSERQQDNVWILKVVIPGPVENPPDIDSEVLLDGHPYQVTGFTKHTDIEGVAFELDLSSTTTGVVSP